MKKIKISELPLSSTHKGLYTIGVDADNNSVKVSLEDLTPYHEEVMSYGVEIDTTNPLTALPRIGNLALHRSLPIQSRMKGVLLNDDGDEVDYLHPTSWLGNTRDGSRGQVMVYIPDFYIKFLSEGNKRYMRMSEYPLPGYTYVPARYVSAYQATVQRSVNKLASVVNMDADFRGCNNQADWDNTYRSALGRPAGALSLHNARNYARNRKAGSTKWNCYTYGTYKILYWLYVVEYANLHSQLPFNAEKDANGFSQGGLGMGLTNAVYAKWGDFNGHYPFAPCGYTDEFGNGSGVKDIEVYDGNSELFVSTRINRYRGIELPFGHIHQRVDGVLVEAGADDDTGLLKVFACKDTSKFSSEIGDGYIHVGNQARTNSYGKVHIFGNGGEVIASETGGSSNTYLCDYNYCNIPASGSQLRGVLVGGSAYNDAHAGFGRASSINAPSDASAYFGSRLCFLPQGD